MNGRRLVLALRAVSAAVCFVLPVIGYASAQESGRMPPAHLLLSRTPDLTGSGTTPPARSAAALAAYHPVNCSVLTSPVVGYEVSRGQNPNDVASLLNDLTADGFSVGTVNISAGPIPSCVDVLIVLGLARNLALSSPYTAEEGAMLRAWAANGHGLMILSDWGFLKDSTQALFQALGYTLLGNSASVVSDPTDFDADGPASTWVIYQTDNFRSHAVLDGIAAVELLRSSWFTPTLNALVTTDADASPSAMPVMAAFPEGAGCAILSADSNWITDGDGAYLKQNNARAARQMIAWLSACGPASRPVYLYLYLPLVVNRYCELSTPYRNTFEAAVGSEWSNPATDLTPSGRRFLGQFGNETVSLALDCLPSHTAVTVSFDLFLIRSWDGNVTFNASEGRMVGPDVWDLSVVGGPTLLHTTFANWTWSGYSQAYPGTYPGGDYAPRTNASENDTLGYRWGDIPLDSVYRLRWTLPHSASSLVLEFSASGLQALSDESWGLDNVEVTLTP